ncbi:hypothetical protein G6F46_015842 [Rhizopus delemar]|nr:hypothetical protein G6F63_014914 [Rhizopus arrhizus]KAG1577361.1 hypothetical protein G6F46_015842 [Rhizopus delemar]
MRGGRPRGRHPAAAVAVDVQPALRWLRGDGAACGAWRAFRAPTRTRAGARCRAGGRHRQLPRTAGALATMAERAVQ